MRRPYFAVVLPPFALFRCPPVPSGRNAHFTGCNVAKRRRKTRERFPTETQPGPGTAPAPEQAAEAPTVTAEQHGWQAAKHLILGIIIAIFALFQIGVFVMFRSGEQIQWKRELAAIESRFADGRYERAAADLTRFGERWSNAQNTFGWNKQMGLYHARAGDWETAARHYERAGEIDAQAPEVHALAGEAWWNADDREKAVAMFSYEIENINPAVGDHDRANYYLGLHLVEEGRMAVAFQHFQAIRDREKWSEELDEVYRRADENYILPTREQAKTITVADLLAATQAPEE